MGTPASAGQARHAVDFAAGADPRQHGRGNVEAARSSRSQSSVSRFINCVRLALVTSVTWMRRSAGEMPDQERVDVAEQHIARFGVFARAGNMVENPADLQTAEVSGEGQAGLGAEAVGAAGLVAREFGDVLGHARVLPHHGIGHRLAGLAVPHHGGFALVGDADGGEIARREGRAGPSLRR